MSPRQKICKIILTFLKEFLFVTIANYPLTKPCPRFLKKKKVPLNTLRDHPHFLVDFTLDVIKGITGKTYTTKSKRPLEYLNQFCQLSWS